MSAALSLLSKPHYSACSSFSVPYFFGTLPRFAQLLFKAFLSMLVFCALHPMTYGLFQFLRDIFYIHSQTLFIPYPANIIPF